MSIYVLSPTQRTLVKTYAIRRWLRSTHYKRAQPTYFATIEDFAQRIRARDKNGNVEGSALAAALAVLLDADRSVAEWFQEKLHNSTELKTEDGWTKLYSVAAAAVVEKYFRERGELPAAEGVLTPEQLADEITEILELAVERGKVAQQLATDAHEAIYNAPHLPNMLEIARERLQRIIEQESLLATPAQGSFTIPFSEREREIAKRALADLRLTDLRNIADGKGLDSSGSFELVADRIARSMDFDRRQIAELVLTYEDPGQPETQGLTTRMVELTELRELADAAPILLGLRGHYIRVGIARWFIFIDVQELADGLLIRGTHRYYRVFAREEEEGDFQLTAHPDEADVDIRLRAGSPWLEMGISKGSQIRSLTSAVERTIGVRAHSTLPLRINRPPFLSAWDHRTIRMLDFLNANLRQSPYSIWNMTDVQFEVDSSKPRDEQDERRPAIVSVRLHGQQLISSRQACELIVSGRRMVSVGLKLRYRPSSSESYLLPVRLYLHDDHAGVHTGFTTAGAAITRAVHNELVGRLQHDLSNSAIDEAALRALAEQIEARALESGSIAEADILTEEQDSDPSSDAADAV